MKLLVYRIPPPGPCALNNVERLEVHDARSCMCWQKDSGLNSTNLESDIYADNKEDVAREVFFAELDAHELSLEEILADKLTFGECVKNVLTD